MSGGEFAAIEARANAASVGPWTPSKADGSWGVHYPGNVCAGPRPQIVTTGANSANTQFIAHARSDIPALLAAVRERDNTIARVREVIEDYDSLGISPYVADALRAAFNPPVKDVPRSAEPIHDHGCDEWCNHCTICGKGTLYGSRCHDHPNKSTPLGTDTIAALDPQETP